MKKALVFTLSLGLIATMCGPVFAHCEIPCGIYGDSMRFVMMKENISTIEKSMNSINELSADPGANMNQLVRWVENKDSHADALSEIVTQYFLLQRVAPVASGQEGHEKYQKQLTLLHGIMVHSMKAKQTTDLAHVEAMRKLVDEFAESYLDAAALAHLREHHG